MKILIHQAYSRQNSGDGLLVDLTRKILSEAIGDDHEVDLIANDAESFKDVESVSQVPCVSSKITERISGLFGNVCYLLKNILLGKQELPEYYRSREEVYGLYVGVGGGYMRGKYLKDTFKCFLNNTIQLAEASRSKAVAVYFPQSIGPFNCSLHKYYVQYHLSKLDLVCVRDDRSLRDLSGLDNVLRLPDLAVMQLAETLVNEKTIEDGGKESVSVEARKIFFVFRKLSSSKVKVENYEDNIKKLVNNFPNSEVVIQSEGRGNNDAVYCEEIFGQSGFRSIKDAIKAQPNSIVVSVRLHGSLESLINGVPSVHLSYERKGFGAYEDLGVEDYVFNALDMDYDSCAERINELVADPSVFWSKVGSSAFKVLKAKEMLRNEIQNAVGAKTEGQK